MLRMIWSSDLTPTLCCGRTGRTIPLVLSVPARRTQVALATTPFLPVSACGTAICVRRFANAAAGSLEAPIFASLRASHGGGECSQCTTGRTAGLLSLRHRFHRKSVHPCAGVPQRAPGELCRGLFPPLKRVSVAPTRSGRVGFFCEAPLFHDENNLDELVRVGRHPGRPIAESPSRPIKSARKQDVDFRLIGLSGMAMNMPLAQRPLISGDLWNCTDFCGKSGGGERDCCHVHCRVPSLDMAE